MLTRTRVAAVTKMSNAERLIVGKWSSSSSSQHGAVSYGYLYYFFPNGFVIFPKRYVLIKFIIDCYYFHVLAMCSKLLYHKKKNIIIHQW
jgi:hypothetical protein